MKSDNIKSLRKYLNATALSVLMAAVTGLSANAQSLKLLDFGTGGVIGQDEPGMMGQGISADGNFVCGSLEMGIGYFVFDVANNQFAYNFTEDAEGAELRNISNTGVAIGYNGPGVTYNIDGVETVLENPDATTYKYVLGESLTNDASVMVGSLVSTGYVTYAAYSKEGGEWTQLPMPAKELLGPYAGKGSSAKYISGDGRVIAGHVGSFGPAIIWTLGDDGKYVPNPIYAEYIPVNNTDEIKPYKTFMPQALSNNGRYLLCTVAPIDKSGVAYPVVYDIQTGTLTVYDEEQAVDPSGVGLTGAAICDDGTFVGLVGMMYYNYGGFIMRAGSKQAKLISEEYPQFAEYFDTINLLGYHVPTGISADGRHISGYGYYCADPYDEEEPAYFTTYVLDTQKSGDDDAAVDDIAPDATGRIEYITIDGIKRNTPAAGLNIVRMPDGKVKKIISKY